MVRSRRKCVSKSPKMRIPWPSAPALAVRPRRCISGDDQPHSIKPLDPRICTGYWMRGNRVTGGNRTTHIARNYSVAQPAQQPSHP
jgi:hypothetical protein